jgi:glycosyltransferase involved in cell wall biosynthesis
MRIAYIVHTFFPNWQAGTEVYARSLARKATVNGHEVYIICYEPPAADAEFFDDIKAWDTVYEGLPVHRISFFKTYRIFHLKEYFHRAVEQHLLEFLSEIRPDVVHIVHSMHLSTAAIWSAKKLGIPVVATATDFWYVCPTYQLLKHDESLCRRPVALSCLACVSSAQPGTWLDWLAKRAFLSRLISPVLSWLAQVRFLPADAGELLIWLSARPGWMRKTLSQVDVLLAPTPNTSRLLGENGITAIEVRTCGFGLETLPVAGRATETGSKLRFGYVGTFRQSKGVHVLLEAVRQLPADRFQLEIYGKTGHFPEYDRRLSALAQGMDNVRFCGTFPNEKLPQVFAGFDVLVIPALWYENSPLVLLSSFSQKVPVVASRVGSFEDLVEHGKNGLLFEMGSASSLATELRRIIDHPELVSRLREGIHDVKTLDENVDELFGIYEQLHSQHTIARDRLPDPPRPLPAFTLACGRLSAKLRLARFGAQFGRQLKLVRFKMALAGGRNLHFSFRWHSGEIRPGWLVFIHVIDRQGRICFQADHPLCRYNQDPWGFVSYTLEIRIAPPDVGDGYSVRLGIWDSTSNERLPVVYTRGLEADLPESAISLGFVELRLSTPAVGAAQRLAP